ncbi:hypothetical protein IGI96_002716 [Enterococcus sp. DIV0421]|uniref:lipopolysaccharide biosynthesis protein n=1 Tax=Enterococcus sp. DIV0421 TaxID=2774688 RepID=UPI003F26C3BD
MLTRIKIYFFNNNNKQFFSDVFLNLISNVLMISVVQFLVFPTLSSSVNSNYFGQIVTIYGINNVIVNCLGNSLNNIRILNREKDRSFTMLAWIINVFSVVSIILFSIVYTSEMKIFDVILFSFVTLLANTRAYCSSYYRIVLKYKDLLKLNFLIVLGNIFGYLMFFKFNSWVILFLFGELFGLLYLFLSKNPLMLELINIEKLGKKVDRIILRDFFQLFETNLIANILNYLDRFLIAPLLGALSMGIFYAASSVSKVFTMIISPMTNVLLSYITQKSFRLTKNSLLKIEVGFLILGFPCYFIMNILSNILVNLLYPSFSEEASKLIPIICVGISLDLVFNILRPFMMRLYSLKYQTIIQMTSGFIYIVFSILLSIYFNLIGFCIAYVLGIALKLFLQTIIIIFFKQNDEE